MKNLLKYQEMMTIHQDVDYLYHPNCYKLIVTDLSRQKNTDFLQQSNFTEKLEKGWRNNVFFLAESNKNCFKFVFRFINHNKII